MPIRRLRKSNRPLRRRKPAMRRLARPVRAYNPSPVFTESFQLPNPVAGGQYLLTPNAGGVLSVTMDNVPQLAQYDTLYQKYRILKATYICIPTHNSAAADVNSEIPPVAGAFQSAGLSRVVFAINNSPNQVVAPVSESAVLEDNGCKIVCGSPKLIMSHRPVPQTQDSTGNRFTVKNQYINFNAVGGNAPHFGITWWHSQPVLPGGAGFGTPYLVYCKLTFQLSDPR